MLVTLGLLVASFLGLLLLPLYKRRTERLQLEQIKRSLPMSEAEIRADKDRLRAEYAIRIHQLETRVEETRHLGARQRIELNRRDGRINSLETEIASMRGALEGHENARRVLEQTITDRLPKLESRLEDARSLLAERDVEIERLTAMADETTTALEEARQINLQQSEELARTKAALATRAARNRDSTQNAAFDAEVALRAEVELLRARTREQGQMVTKLQQQLTRSEAAAANAGAAATGLSRAAESRYEDEIQKLRTSLLEAEEALGAARSSADADAVGQRSLERERAALKGRVNELETEVSRLKASLSTYQEADRSDTAVKESKVTLKARLNALEATSQSQLVTIQSLRAELAAANDRMARQAAQFREELKRLNAGTKPASTEPRVVKQPVRRPSLADRMAAPRPVVVAEEGIAGARAGDTRTADTGAGDAGSGNRRVGNFLKALSGGADAEARNPSSSPQSAPTPAAQPSAKVAAVAGVGDNSGSEKQRDTAQSASPRRPSLLDRISDAGKS